MTWGILENKKICVTLSKMILNNRLPHAILLAGEKGTGKTMLAKKLAQAVNCLTPNINASPCNICINCQKIINNSHPDLLIIEPSGRSQQIKIEDIKNLISNIHYKPYEGLVKVFIIRQADRLLKDTANAFLKTLEEPPQNSLLILNSSSENNLMPTILSRCLRLKVEPLSQKTILNKLNEIYAKQEDKETNILISNFCQGSLGLALTLQPEKIWQNWKSLDIIFNSDRMLIFNNLLLWIKEICTNPEEDLLLIVALIKFWWNQSIILKVKNKLAKASWLNTISIEEINEIILNIENLEDSLKRFIKPELAFEQFFLAALKLNNN